MHIYTSKKIFNDYVMYMFEKRLISKSEKNDVLSNWFKLLMNSLYGKLG